jgi:hypothetical protein
MRGAIVSLSAPRPQDSWRWGGPDWDGRSAAGLQVAGVTVAVRDQDLVTERWETVLGTAAHSVGVEFVGDQGERGLVEIALAVPDEVRDPVEIGGVRFVFGLR